MLTTVSTTLFLLGIAFFFFRLKRKLLGCFFIILSVFALVLLTKAQYSLLEVADMQISERRTLILNKALVEQAESPVRDEFFDLVEKLTLDDGIFSNRDYRKVSRFIPAKVTSEVNKNFPEWESEEALLNKITAEDK